MNRLDLRFVNVTVVDPIKQGFGWWRASKRWGPWGRPKLWREMQFVRSGIG